KLNKSQAALTLLGDLVTSMGAAGTLTLLALWAVRVVNNLTILRLRPEPTVSHLPSLILVGIFLATTVLIALVGPSGQIRNTAIIVTTCVYLVHIFITFGMYVSTIVIPTTEWTVHTNSLVLNLTITIAIAFPFVELTGVVMALDWRGARGIRRPAASAASVQDQPPSPAKD